MKFAAPCILHFEAKQTAANMSAAVLSELEPIGISADKIQCSLFDNAEAATGRAIQQKTRSGVQPCILHSLSKGIKHSCGHEKYKKEIAEKQKFNNPEGGKLLKSTGDQVKVFEKS